MRLRVGVRLMRLTAGSGADEAEKFSCQSTSKFYQ